MTTYEGMYIENNGEKTPYKMITEDNKLHIIYDEKYGKVIKSIRLVHSDKYLWKVNKKSVSCKSPISLIKDVFEFADAYANVTFREFCR